MASASSGLSESRASRYLEHMFVSRVLHWPGEKGKPTPTIFQILAYQSLTDGIGKAQRAEHDVDVVAVADFAFHNLSRKNTAHTTFVTKSF